MFVSISLTPESKHDTRQYVGSNLLKSKLLIAGLSGRVILSNFPMRRSNILKLPSTELAIIEEEVI